MPTPDNVPSSSANTATNDAPRHASPKDTGPKDTDPKNADTSLEGNYPTPAGLTDDLAELAEEEDGSTDPAEIDPKSMNESS